MFTIESTHKDNACLLHFQVESIEMERKENGEKGEEIYRWRKDLGKERKGWKSLKEKEKKKTKK